ncbi:MAG TPA: site-specific DNA-methyltransferase [Chthonomonadaceae bacterium]|nr:site-specific DNA-methyltransferase [Chthonomonadaceae bacterium]
MTPQVRLEWEGKRAAGRPPPAELHLWEEYCLQPGSGPANRLIQGDNLAVMAVLKEELAGQIALIYLDPPFFTGMDRQAAVGEGKATLAYTDDWNGDLGVYLQWLYDRFSLARELLREDGCLYVHLSWHASHYARLLLDEIFGATRFQNEIAWCYREAINSKKRWNRKHDTLLFYSKGERFTFNADAVREPYAASHVKKYRLRDERGAYRLMGRGLTGSPLRSRRDLPPEYETRFPGLTYRHYLGEGTLPVDYWLIDIENQASPLRTGYPTQKPEALLERILLASSHLGDLIADFCCGSGTTLAVASRLGRRWIGCDVGDLAIHTTRKRLLETISEDGFRVESTDQPPSQAAPATSEAVRVEFEGRKARLRLTPEAVRWVDMWAVQWPKAGAENRVGDPLRPDWWAVRTRRTPVLTEVSPLFPLSSYLASPSYGPLLVTVALADAAGATSILPIPLDPPAEAMDESPSL